MSGATSAYDQREARLRREYAGRYPGCPAGEWVAASTAAGYVLAHRAIMLGPVQAGTGRALDDDAWEFRGGSATANTGRGSRRRFTDRHHTSGPYPMMTQVPV